ncbi:MAG: hypothetical protein KDA69_04475 [Planctomycetaceae bacterium]|nr:hypothetical protein [Planctomycetaceae bacterium]
MFFLLFACISQCFGIPLTAIVAFIVVRAIVNREYEATSEYSYLIPWVVLLVIYWSAVALVVFNMEYDGPLG